MPAFSLTSPNSVDRIKSLACPPADWLQSLVLLYLRLTLGFELAESGFAHLSDIAGTVENFKKWGVPLPYLNVLISGVTELGGGSLLMLGLATRLIAFPLIFNFIVAIIAAGRGKIAAAFVDGKGFHPTGGWDAITDDTAFPFLALALIMFAFGAGKISVDRVLCAKLFCGKGHTAQAAGS
jgi:putative oxidoreductase